MNPEPRCEPMTPWLSGFNLSIDTTVDAEEPPHES